MQPHQLAGAGLNPDKLGVAAALWDGALVLAGYLAAQPAYKYLGADVGAGAQCVRRGLTGGSRQDTQCDRVEH